MSDEDGSAPSAHGLGPHVVGQRVVVRRLLPGETGPSGGPAMTDVLGVCESWAEGEALIRTEDGTAVLIPTALIVSGKPVPPRPRPRGRVSVREAESHAAAMWPGVHREALGDWELRTEPQPVGRLRKRANSCLAIGDPGVAFADAAAMVREFYAARDRRVLVQVETGSDLAEEFLAAGWSPVDGGDATFLIGSVASARRRLPEVPDLEVESDGDRMSVRTPAGSGSAVVDGDWLGVHDLEVAPEHRRQGVARGLLAALVEAGAERGALTLWLHVEVDNEPALALYEGLGLSEHHGCRYLEAPSAR